MDYYILFRDLDAPTPIDYVKRCYQEDLLIADKTSYVWGYIGELNNNQIREVQARLVWEDAKRYYEAGNSLGASGLTKFVFEIEIGAIGPAALDYLAQISPHLAFLPGASPTHRFWFYPESDAESLRINQALSSIPLQNNRDFSWRMPTAEKPMLYAIPTGAISSPDEFDPDNVDDGADDWLSEEENIVDAEPPFSPFSR